MLLMEPSWCSLTELLLLPWLYLLYPECSMDGAHGVTFGALEPTVSTH